MQSSALVNELSDQARADAIRFAQEEFAEAEENLRVMRARLSDFRRENRIVDPSGDVAGQSGLLNALQAELAQALVERDMLLSFVGDEDQRVIQANRRITAVEGRIEAERASLGVSGTAGALPEVVGRYEELLVDLEFANTAYTQTLAGLTAARAEARRQSRYLAPHVRPTAGRKRALSPPRHCSSGLVGLFLTARLGRADARLLQRARQPLIRCRRRPPAMIEFRNVSKYFLTNTGRKVIVDQLNLRLPFGAKVGLLGRNGAGKTTLMAMVAGSRAARLGRDPPHRRDLLAARLRRRLPRRPDRGAERALRRADLRHGHRRAGRLRRRLRRDRRVHGHAGPQLFLGHEGARLAFGMAMGITFDWYLVDETHRGRRQPLQEEVAGGVQEPAARTRA